ncbi:alpha/beta hydrolase [Sphingopyxis sp. PET50]|uniref:alpha/beta hydrolase n=1 Tax=Sphingopyxis sp. PET50 TaxID=2976533 RepID=UPI0021AF9EF6|nr:alpha/beta fold hydrolase [Sphingopyxis sp. PET50]
MPDVIFPGPEGRIEGRFSPPPRPRAPVALILHPHPQGGGTMNDRITQAMYKSFVARGFAVLRFNFRGVGRSQGTFDNGIGELSDAASALDWVQSIHPEAQTTWVAGFSFGAWIGMQLLMRRPEIRGFLSVAPLRRTCMISAFWPPAPPPASSLRAAPTRSCRRRRFRSWSTSCARKRASRSITTRSRARTISSSMNSTS